MKVYALLPLIAFMLLSCHSSKVAIQKLDHYPMESTLFAEIKIDKKDLVQLLNQKIDTALRQPITTGNIQMSVSRAETMSMSIKGDHLLYSLPVHIEAKMSSFAKAKGRLVLWFKSNYKFQEDWTLTTKTQVSDFQWIEQPKAELFGLQLPIEKLSNLAIDHFGPVLARTIDEQMEAYSDFRPQIQTLLDSAASPILVDSVHHLWLTGEPKRFGLAPFFDNGETLLSGIYNTSIFTIHHKKPQIAPLKTPKLEIKPFKKQKTQIHVNAIFTADSLSELLKEQMIGMELPFGNKKIKIEDIDIDFAGRLLRSKIKVSGGINGYIDGSGAPYMNKEHTKLKINDFDIKLTGSNLIMRNGIKLFRKKIQKLLEESINDQIRQMSQEAIQKIRKDYSFMALSPIINLAVLPDNQITFNFETRKGSLLYLQISLNGVVQLNVNAHGRL
ncbi:MAG TPA: DUF4403 family protein [Saprospiraceae bacterium]|nr:DUF4403 family protein [Saprospiraceae bacterium]